MAEYERARPYPGLPGPIGYALWHLEEARDRTLAYVEGITQDALDTRPVGHRHSVATLLYHIAVFEVDWVYTDVLGNPYDMERLKSDRRLLVDDGRRVQGASAGRRLRGDG